ncbi:MAG TPA: serine/threonine-protein kinase, partial [Luteolibacter sp.]|nr:serine/threonine-protein kinase [Luteolibacter sp.]
MTYPLSTSAWPDCGAPLPPEHSLCPACLMRQALASRTLARDGDKTPQLPPPSPEEIADRFPGYEILECLGRGGMGAVYKARQKSLNRLVAIKILAPERVGDGRFAERFTIEAELLAKLGHPHIVTIHDFGETGGLFYLVMEFIDGVNLRDLLRDGKLESQQALAIVPPICDALQYAHDKGIVHRDIKPENILLDRDGRVKIADFGIASLVGASGEKSGTPPYMAPEQSGGTVDRRADIYALGVVLYEMLTGERPEKNLMAPSSKVQLDVKIDEIVLRALEKEPERRYQTAREFRTMVETMAATPPEPKRDETRFAGEQRQEGRGRVLVAQIETWAARYGWLSVIAIGSGLLIILGAIANFHFTLGVGKSPMMMVGSIFVAGGIIGAAIGSGRNRSGEAADSAYGDQEDFRKQNKRPRPSATSAANPRFSRPAMVGACWASFAIIALFLANIKIGPSSSPGTGRVWWQWLLVFTVLPLGVTAPFGTTILGWISIAGIRRSSGKLYGLGLAVFDGLLFPLLILAGLIGWFWNWV